jgi:hypothetical protein
MPVSVSVNNIPSEEFYLLALLATCLKLVSCLFFDPEDEGDMLLRKVG